ncbi:DNA repair protein RecO [Methylococcaceae bacterium WWC4]|nr:DNA repair protein RecO [Methylococcaceae bacterium WWC4]
MSDSTVYLQPAYILQHRPYRETSLLLEVFTRDYGVVSMLAKGVRKQKSKSAGLLLPFTALKLSFSDRGELKTLVGSEFVRQYPLERLALYCGFYVNELVQLFLHRHDPHPALFAVYRAALRDLTLGVGIEQTLRYFELDLLREAGYEVELAVAADRAPISPRERYDYRADQGWVLDAGGRASGTTLLALAKRDRLQDGIAAEAKVILRQLLDGHLRGRPLKSREVLATMLKHL